MPTLAVAQRNGNLADEPISAPRGQHHQPYRELRRFDGARHSHSGLEPHARDVLCAYPPRRGAERRRRGYSAGSVRLHALPSHHSRCHDDAGGSAKLCAFNGQHGSASSSVGLWLWLSSILRAVLPDPGSLLAEWERHPQCGGSIKTHPPQIRLSEQ